MNSLEDWLNADNQPRDMSQVFLDATKGLPLPEGSFDYIFSEHMIEHVDYDHQGLSLLKDCHRIAKPGGRIRIATPDIASIIGLYAAAQSGEQNRYLEWALSYERSSTRAFRTVLRREPLHACLGPSIRL